MILLEDGRKIKVVDWSGYDFIEIELMDQYNKTLRGELAYSEDETNKRIEQMIRT